MRRALACCALVVFASVAPIAVWAAETDTGPAPDLPQAKDPLAGREQIVRDRMTQLEDRMYRLTEKLAKTEPEQAKRLETALRQTRELLIRRNMEEVITLLEQGRLTDANDKQAQIEKDLDRVLALLLEDSDAKQRQQELERLREYRKQIGSLLQEQQRLKNLADAEPRLRQMLADIQAAIARLQGLIQQQEQEIAKSQAGASGQQGGKLADSQREVRKSTEALAEELKNPAHAGTQPAGERPQATRPAGERPQTTEPAGANDESRKANEGAKQARSASEGRAGKSPASQPSAASQPADIEAGMRQAGGETAEAGSDMQSAEAQLQKNAAGEASPKQQAAAEHLRRAMKELQKKEADARKLLDQAQAARKQRELQQQAEKLAQKMGGKKSGESAPSGSQPEGGQQGQQGKDSKEGQQQQPTPGGDNVQRAGRQMRKAADDLDEQKPGDASPKQQKAIDELQEAQRQLEETLEQLRKEQQEELLRGLEARFRAMLAQQLIVNKGTDDLIAKGQAAWAHADELTLAGLGQDEKKLSDDAGQALTILKEDGTTIVFPRLVGQLQQDMLTVSGRLTGRKADALTQTMEADLVTALTELIDSVKKMRQELASGMAGGGGGGGAGNEPLLPGSAELKLLRSCQERINHQVSAAAAGTNGDEVKQQLRRIADRQKEVADMARKMNERLTGQ